MNANFVSLGHRNLLHTLRNTFDKGSHGVLRCWDIQTWAVSFLWDQFGLRIKHFLLFCWVSFRTMKRNLKKQILEKIFGIRQGKHGETFNILHSGCLSVTSLKIYRRHLYKRPFYCFSLHRKLGNNLQHTHTHTHKLFLVHVLFFLAVTETSKFKFSYIYPATDYVSQLPLETGLDTWLHSGSWNVKVGYMCNPTSNHNSRKKLLTIHFFFLLLAQIET